MSDVTWSRDSTSLISVALERGETAAILWDIKEAKVARTFSGKGACMLAVQYNPNDSNMFIACDTKDHMLVFDTRQQQPAMTVCNDCMVPSHPKPYLLAPCREPQSWCVAGRRGASGLVGGGQGIKDRLMGYPLGLPSRLLTVVCHRVLEMIL